MKKTTIKKTTILRSQRGDTAAFEDIIRTFEKPIYGFISKMVRNPDDVEELAQETFFRAYKGIHTFDTDRKFSTWLFSIAKYSTYGYLKKNRKRLSDAPLSGEEKERLLYEAVKDTHVEQRLQRSIDVEKSLNTLRTPYRRVLTLFYWHEYSYKQIARRLELPMNTVKTHLRRAKKEFKKTWHAKDQ